MHGSFLSSGACRTVVATTGFGITDVSEHPAGQVHAFCHERGIQVCAGSCPAADSLEESQLLIIDDN